MTPEKQQQWRRAIRTAVYTATVLTAVGFIGWIIYLVRDDAPSLLVIALGLLGIVLISVMGYSAENIAQHIEFKAGLSGVEGSIGGDK